MSGSLPTPAFRLPLSCPAADEGLTGLWLIRSPVCDKENACLHFAKESVGNWKTKYRERGSDQNGWSPFCQFCPHVGTCSFSKFWDLSLTSRAAWSTSAFPSLFPYFGTSVALFVVYIVARAENVYSGSTRAHSILVTLAVMLHPFKHRARSSNSTLRYIAEKDRSTNEGFEKFSPTHSSIGEIS